VSGSEVGEQRHGDRWATVGVIICLYLMNDLVFFPSAVDAATLMFGFLCLCAVNPPSVPSSYLDFWVGTVADRPELLRPLHGLCEKT